MANYWTEYKKERRIYTAWPGGWEVISCVEENVPVFKKGMPTGKTKNEIRYGHGKMPAAATKDWKRKLSMDIRIAQASKNKEEYRALRARIGQEDYEYIIEKDLRGPSLRDWAFNTPTSQEYYNLLRYN